MGGWDGGVTCFKEEGVGVGFGEGSLMNERRRKA